MLESIILGVAQGVAEWLPVSSEGLITLIKANFFTDGAFDLEATIRLALFLHLGTFLAALIYFRKDVWRILKLEDKKVFNFLAISTVVSGAIGFVILKSTIGLIEEFSSQTINIVVGLLLLVTAWLSLKDKISEGKKSADLKPIDGLYLGIVQGLAALPGLSRSGLTVATLLLRKFDDQTALKLSFLMSLPIVLAGNIILNYDYFTFNTNNLAGLAASFVFGLITIHYLLKLARKINFGYFVLGFGLLLIASSLI